jgi:hypothetical protein
MTTMAHKPLEYSIFPWTASVSGQTGFLLSIRWPSTGDRGQGFYLTYEEAICAYYRALHHYNSGENPLESLDGSH